MREQEMGSIRNHLVLLLVTVTGLEQQNDQEREQVPREAGAGSRAQ